MQILILALVAILAVASRSDPSSAQRISAHSGSSGSQQHHDDKELKITGAFVDLDAKAITIFGQDFYFPDKYGRYPRVVRFQVSLGEEDITARCLPPIGPEPTTTRIVCNFSGQDDRLPDDGDYRLTVATGRGDRERDQYDLTVGAVGPKGEPGPAGTAGPPGPTGAMGPQGATGAQGPQGLAGVQGPQGETGATGAQGAKGLRWRGAWNAAADYAPDDAVQFEGSGYVALQPATNKNPAAEAAFWSLLAQKGDQGDKGDKGDPGDTGAQGPQGPQGATGAQGPQGPAGPAGVAGLRTARSGQLSVSPHSALRVQLLCLSNEYAVSGGFHFLDHESASLAFAERFRLVSSGPGSTDHRRWVTVVRNETSDTGAGFAFIICARTP